MGEREKTIKDLIETMIILASKAGLDIMEVYSREDFGTTYKDGGSPLTLADRASNDAIAEGLSKIAPDIPVLSEESKQAPYEVRGQWERFFLVDPLDGTKEFIKRNGEFTVNIALIEGGSPVFGVVHAPALGVTYCGVKGQGAVKIEGENVTKIHVRDYDGGTLTLVASRSHRGAELEGFLERVEGSGRAEGTEFLSMGSSLKICLVAEGAAHLYPRFGPTMEWDTGAAHAVLEAAGGTLTALDGAPLVYNKEDLHNPYFVASGAPSFPWQDFVGGPV